MPRPTIELIPGPLTSQMTRTQAESALSRHPGLTKQTSFSIEPVDGRWVAALVHQSAPPFGAPADDDEESAGPKSEGPDDTGDSDAGGPPEGPPSEGDDGPPKDEKGGDKALLHHLLDIVTQMATALGVPVDPGASPVPGADDPGMPPPGGPPGAGGPPPPDKTVHERAMKPGETPPGGTPLGAPAFASVAPDHPWAHIIGQVASFHIEEPIGDTPLREVEAALQDVASGTGFKVKDFSEGVNDDGHRVAKAFVTVH